MPGPPWYGRCVSEAPAGISRFWPFRRKPLGPVAQCIVELLEDEAAWRPRLMAMHHQRGGVVVRCSGFHTSVTAGSASMRLQGRDCRAVERAYAAAKRRLAERQKAERERRVHQALGLPDQPAGAAPAAEAVETLETIEAVEARVRRLRQALAQATNRP